MNFPIFKSPLLLGSTGDIFTEVSLQMTWLYDRKIRKKIPRRAGKPNVQITGVIFEQDSTIHLPSNLRGYASRPDLRRVNKSHKMLMKYSVKYMYLIAAVGLSFQIADLCSTITVRLCVFSIVPP
jgi:hypothetical protein